MSQSWTRMPPLTLPLSSVTMGESLPLSEPQVLMKMEVWCVTALGDTVGLLWLRLTDGLDKYFPLKLFICKMGTFGLILSTSQAC